MKKKVFIVFMLFISITPMYELHAEDYSNNSEVRVLKNIDKAPSIEQELSIKEIKKEIKRRKKFHKSLVAKYNATFNEKYLDIITDNSLKITNLQSMK